MECSFKHPGAVTAACTGLGLPRTWLFYIHRDLMNYWLHILDSSDYRFGRPGVEMNVQHETNFAVIQLVFLVNEVSARLVNINLYTLCHFIFR